MPPWPGPIMTFIGKTSRVGDLAQQLRGHTALTEDMSLGPTIDDGWLLTTRNHSSKAPTPSSGLHTVLMCKNPYSDTHIYIIKVFKKYSFI